MTYYGAGQLGVGLYHRWFGRSAVYYDDPEIQRGHGDAAPPFVVRKSYRILYVIGVLLMVALFVGGGFAAAIYLPALQDYVWRMQYPGQLVFGSWSRFLVFFPAMFGSIMGSYYLTRWLSSFSRDFYRFVTFNSIVTSSVQREQLTVSDLDELRERELMIRDHIQRNVDLDTAAAVIAKRNLSAARWVVAGLVVLTALCALPYGSRTRINDDAIETVFWNRTVTYGWKDASALVVTPSSHLDSKKNEYSFTLTVKLHIGSATSIEIPWNSSVNGTPVWSFIGTMALAHGVPVRATDITEQDRQGLARSGASYRQQVAALFEWLYRNKVITTRQYAGQPAGEDNPGVAMKVPEGDPILADATKKAQANIGKLTAYCSSPTYGTDTLAVILKLDGEKGNRTAIQTILLRCSGSSFEVAYYSENADKNGRPDKRETISSDRIGDWVVINKDKQIVDGGFLTKEYESFVK